MGDLDDSALQYLTAMRRGRPEQIIASIHESLSDAASLRDLYRNVLLPAHAELGRLYAASDETGDLESLIDTILSCQELLGSLTPSVFALQPTQGIRALVAPVPGELYGVSAWTAADYLQIEGFDTQLLAAPSTLEVIENALETEPVDVLILSMNRPGSLPAAQMVRDRLAMLRPDLAVIVTGLPVGLLPLPSIHTDAGAALVHLLECVFGEQQRKSA